MDHVFVLNAIVGEKRRNKNSDLVDIVFYDIKDACNSLWLDNTILDLKKKGIDTNILNIFYSASM